MLIGFNILNDYKITPKGVFHVGMHRAEEYPIYKDAGVETIIFVEANEDLVNSCHIPDDKCRIVHAAVSDRVETVKFNITNNGESSSILELGDHAMIYPGIVNIKSVEMQTTTIDSIHKTLGIDESTWNILNLDIQGAELQALRGIENWEHIDAIFTEVNFREMYRGCAHISQIDEFLATKGLRRVETVDTGAGWGDALYIKTIL